VKEEPKDERNTVKQELETTLSKPPFNVFKLYRAKKRFGRPVKIEAGEFKVTEFVTKLLFLPNKFTFSPHPETIVFYPPKIFFTMEMLPTA
jgi:hypothetical protein